MISFRGIGLCTTFRRWFCSTLHRKRILTSSSCWISKESSVSPIYKSKGAIFWQWPRLRSKCGFIASFRARDSEWSRRSTLPGSNPSPVIQSTGKLTSLLRRNGRLRSLWPGSAASENLLRPTIDFFEIIENITIKLVN